MKYYQKNLKLAFLTIISCFVMMNLQGQDLKKHRWTDRILIVNAKSKDAVKYQKQLKELDNSIQGLVERKLVLYQIVADNYKLTDFKDKSNKEGDVDSKFVKQMFDKNAAFEVILIGLDGGVKLRQTTVLLMKELYEIIDVMPMRQQEIRTKNGSKGKGKK